MLSFYRTKIVATIGPASSSSEVLEKMIMGGVDVCRLNMSHGDPELDKLIIKRVRELSNKHERNTSILVDLQGPKIRIGEVENNEVLLKEGQTVLLTTKECTGNASQLHINYAQFPNDVTEGETILIDDGKIRLRILSTNGKDGAEAEVINGGMLSSRKGVNLPNTKISLPNLTEKDHKDLKFALEQDVDWIGLSFVRKAQDIIELKKIIHDAGKDYIRVIAKIEKPEAIEDIDNIIAKTDALMVARGDLGVEMPMHEVPIIQKMLVKKCIEASKPVIIATQMMESMINNFAPTRAEVNDVANSILDGADAVMLSGETAVGKFPVRVIEYIHNIISSVEEEVYPFDRFNVPDPASEDFVSDSVCYNACVMASQVNAKAIIGMTRSGYTAYKVACRRPKADIIIFTNNKPILSVLSLVWGVKGFFYDETISTDHTIADLHEILKKKKLINAGDIVVNLASIPIEERLKTNMIKLSRVR